MESVAADRVAGGETGNKALLLVVSGSILAVLILAAIGWRESWDFSESVGVAGLFTSVAGFSVALVEIQRTQAVSIATATAIDSTLREVATGRLTIAITELRFLLSEVEDSVEEEDGPAVRRGLTGWSHTGGDAEGLMQRRYPDGHKAMAPLRTSIKKASDTKLLLAYEGINSPAVLGEIRVCLASMNKATHALGPLIEDLHSSTEDPK